MELRLKPCPFCGGKGRVRKLKNGYRIVCKECGGSSHYAFTQSWHDNKYVAQCQAAKAWNSRPTPINSPLTLDELRQMDGEPVWVQYGNGTQGWAIVDISFGALSLYGPAFGECECPQDEFINMEYDDPAGYFGLHVLGWRAYRRKPENGTE